MTKPKGLLKNKNRYYNTTPVREQMLPELVVKPIDLTLDTWYPTNKQYPIGHSRLYAYDSNNGNAVEITKYTSDKDYNLIKNNCSDATRRALESLSGKRMNPFLFTTPGDALDFFKSNFNVVRDKLPDERLTNSYHTTISKQELENLQKMKDSYSFKNGGSIYIKPSKRGTFRAAASRHGMGTLEFASRVLANKDNYSPAMVKKANFARNASKWH